MKRTRKGSCHRGAVAFECDVDLAEGTSRCNCSMCAKGRFWKAVVPARFVKGEGELTGYRFGSGRIEHPFCKRCGIKPAGRAEIPELGAIVAINVACLDDATPEELAEVPIAYQDGLHDDWDAEPRFVRHL